MMYGYCRFHCIVLTASGSTCNYNLANKAYFLFFKGIIMSVRLSVCLISATTMYSMDDPILIKLRVCSMQPEDMPEEI